MTRRPTRTRSTSETPRRRRAALALAAGLVGSSAILLPGGVAAQRYRIQVVAAVNPDKLTQISQSLQDHLDAIRSTRPDPLPLEIHLVRAQGWYKLQIGDFRSEAEAETSVSEVRSWGFPDAWVTSSATVVGAQTSRSGSQAGPSRESGSMSVPIAPVRDPPVGAIVARATPRRVPALPSIARTAEPQPSLTPIRLDATDPWVAVATLDRLNREAGPTVLSAARLVTTVATRYESNIDHDEEPLSAWGVITGVGFEYRFDNDDTEVAVSYEVARHEYEEAPHWSRLGHVARVELERELGGPWNLEIAGEASLGGSTEDRELANVYALRPRLELELGRSSRLRLNTALRLKRFDGEPDRNATAPYVGLEFRRLFGPLAWSISSRYDVKHTPSERRRYRRWTSETELALPSLFGSRLEIGLKYRMKNYGHRLVELEDGDEVLRRDRRIKPSLAWVQPFGDRFEARLDYEFESRTSNDPDKPYAAHLFGFALRARVP